MPSYREEGDHVLLEGGRVRVRDRVQQRFAEQITENAGDVTRRDDR